MPTLFTKIITGQIPCYKIFEDEYTFAFLDLYPHNLGHLLIVPKIEVGDYRDLPEPYFSTVFNNSKFLGKAVQSATGCLKVALVVLGMGVPDHFHLHLIPIFSEDDINTNKAQKRSDKEMLAIQEKILKEIEILNL